MTAPAAATVCGASRASALVLTCEHASRAIPPAYDNLGVDEEALNEHIAWDIGAAALTEALVQRLNATAVLCAASRLLIDCNRALGDADLIVAESHGVRVPGNGTLDAAERARRIRDFYVPYHAAVDDVLARHPGALVCSVHSFTPQLNGCERRFDVGVLFDAFAAEATVLGETLASAGLVVRYNEPYSALDGLIFSARTHGERHGRRYLELEVNNRLLRDAAGVSRVAGAAAAALAQLLEP